MSDTPALTSTTLLEPGVHFNLLREIYDKDPGHNQSRLKAFLKAPTPAHFKYDLDHPAEKDSSALVIGSAIDCLIWNPAEFKNQFIVWEGKIKRGKDWDAFEATAAAMKLTVLTVKEHDQIRGMIDSLEAHDEISDILHSCHKQVGIIATHPNGFRMKGMIDLMPNPEDGKLAWLFDFKSTGVGAGPRDFHDLAFKMQYDLQAIFYTDLAHYAGLLDVKNFGFIVQENFAPYLCAIHYLELTDEIMTAARARYMKAMGELDACIKFNNWPGYHAAWTKIQFKPWQLNPNAPRYETLA